jgi:hypothetical protein
MEKGDIVFPGCLFKGKFQFFLLAINVFTFESVIINKNKTLLAAAQIQTLYSTKHS